MKNALEFKLTDFSLSLEHMDVYDRDHEETTPKRCNVQRRFIVM
jgi:hypothetical protein